MSTPTPTTTTSTSPTSALTKEPSLDPNPLITTPRLHISHLLPTNTSHADLTLSLLHSPFSMKHRPSGPTLIPDRAAAQAFIATGADRMVRTGYGRYCVSLRPSNSNPNTNPTPQSQPQSDHATTEKEDQTLEHIGVISCQLARHPSHPSPSIPDIGFNFLPPYHGRGYATEAAGALMKYYRERRGCRAFAGLTDPDNEAAKKCLSRLGFLDRGVRGVAGVVDAGRVRELSVWTVGVGEGAGALEEVGL